MHLTPDELIDLAEGARVESASAHLQTCDLCRGEVAALKSAISSAASVEVPDPSPLFWEHLSARVSESVAAEGSPDRAWRWGTMFRPSWSAVAMASVATAIAVAIYVTAPRELRPTGPGPVAPDAAAEVLLQPFGAVDDPSLILVADLTGQLDPDAVASAGWTNHAGGVEEVVANLTNDERLELQRLLQEALDRRDAS
jgi:hypothetical protein